MGLKKKSIRACSVMLATTMIFNTPAIANAGPGDTGEASGLQQENSSVRLSQTVMNLTNATPEGMLRASAADGKNYEWIWESEDEAIAEVKDGLVTAKGNGTVKITVTAKEDASVTSVCTVTVTGCEEASGETAVQENVISQTADSVTIGRESISTGGLFITSDMSKTSFTSVGYAGDMPVVDGKAQFTITKRPVKEGAGFTNEPLQAGDTFQYWVRVNTAQGQKMEGPFSYTHGQSEEVAAESITMKPEKVVSMQVGDIYQLAGDLQPVNVTDKEVIWSTEDEEIVSVGGTRGGLLTAKKAGSTIVTVETKDKSLKATCVVTVEEVDAEPEETAVTSVSVTPGTASAVPGGTRQFSASVQGTGEFSSEVVWSVEGAVSEDTSIDAAGLLTVGEDETAETLTVKAVSVMDESKSGTGKVTIKEEEDAVQEELQISQKVLELTNATTEGMLAVSLGEAPADVNWISEDETIVTVQDGKVTAAGNGTTQIRAELKEDPSVAVECEVTVTGYGMASQGTASEQENVISQTADSVTIGRESTSTGGLFITSDMSKTSFTAVGYAGDMPVVDGKAQFTITKKPVKDGAGFTSEPLEAGDVFQYWIRVNTAAGQKMEGPFTYTHGASSSVEATGVSMRPLEDVTMQTGRIYQLAAAIAPLDVSDTEVEWTSDKEDVVSVEGSKGGLLKAGKPGTATVTVTTKDGGYTASCKVTVEEAVTEPEETTVTGVVITPETAEVRKGSEKTFTAQVQGTGSPSQKVEWSVSGAASAETTIDASGTLRVAAEETAEQLVVQAVSEADPGKSAQATVTVKEVTEETVELLLSQETLELTNGTPEGKLAAEVEGAEDVELVWSTSDAGVVTVEDGKVTAKGNGTATITVSAEGDEAECDVTVTGYGMSSGGEASQQENVISQTADSVTIGRESTSTGGLFVTSDMSKTSFTQVGYAGDMPVVDGKAQFTISKMPVKDGAGFTNEALKVGDTFKYWIRVNTAAGQKMEGPFEYTHGMSSEIQATGVEMRPVESVELEVGDIYQLAGDIAPVDVTNTEVEWASDDTDVVTVGGSRGGLVTAVGEGTAVVTVKTADGSFEASCEVTVGDEATEPEETVVTGVKVTPAEGKVQKGESLQFQAQVEGTGNPSQEVKWTISGNLSEETTISEDGLLTAAAEEEAETVEVTAVSVADESKSATVQVTITDEPTAAEEIRISQNTMKLTNGTRSGILRIYEGTVEEVVSDNTEVATVSRSGNDIIITAVEDGTATILCRTGKETAECVVEVSGTAESLGDDDYVASHIMDQAEDGSYVTLGNGKGGVFFATSDLTRTKTEGDGKPALAGYPLTPAGYKVTRMPNEQGHLEGGEVSPLAKGDKFVYFFLTEGKLQGPYLYTNGISTSAVEGVDIVPEGDLKIDINEVYQLAASVNPADSGNVTVTWESSDPSIASVENGFVTGLSQGSVTLTATTEEGAKAASCRVQVGADIAAERIELDKTELSVPVKLGMPLTATVYPENATNTKIVWESADPEIAVVNNGVVSGIKEGETVVTATIENTDISAQCAVTVVKAVNPGDKYPDGSVNTGDDGKAPPVTMDHVKPEVDESLQSDDSFMYFTLSNNTDGKYSDEEIFVTVLGREWNENELQPFSYLKPDGSLPLISTRTNDQFKWMYNPVSGLVDTKREFTNLGFSLAELKAMGQVDSNGNVYVKVPPIRSGRMYLSYGEDICIEIKGGDFAGPALENPTDPNQGIVFDFVEFTYNDIGQFWGNTTRVDGYVFPISIRLTGTDDVLDEDGNVIYDENGNALQQDADKWVGDIGTLDEIYARWDYETREGTLFEKFNHLLVRDENGNPERIKAPGKGEFDSEGTGEYTDYYDEYVDYVWDMYTSPFDPENPMVFTTQAGRFVQTGVASSAPGCNGKYEVKDGDPLMVFKREVWNEDTGEWYELYPERRYYIHKPSTGEVFEGKGAFDHHHDQGYSFENGTDDRMDLVIQSQMCAAFNRGVAHLNEKVTDIYSTNPNDPEGIYSDGRPIAPWGDVARYYTVDDVNKGVFNFYAKFWHEFGVGNKAYGYCYDDVWEQATLLYIRHANNLSIDFRK